MSKCRIEHCGKKVLAVGLCSGHYRKLKIYGDPTVSKQAQMHGVTLGERLIANFKTQEGCWPWVGYKDPNGYGRIRVGSVPALAHRAIYEMVHSVKLTPDQHVMHTCDNPGCVRPSHLRLGDHVANMADKMQKGRHVYGTSKGEAHGCAKLTDDMVRDIRASTMKGKDLAVIYRVSATTISDIRNRRIWRHLD